MPGNFWFELDHIDSAEFWLNEGYSKDELCKMCGEPDNRLYEGYCKDCIAKIYDEHEPEMLPFFVKYPPNEWDEECHDDIGVLWTRATVERFYMRFDKYAVTRHYLKQYALEDLDCLTDWMKERGMI